MGDYINTNQSEFLWHQQNQAPGISQTYYEQDYSQFTSQQLGKNNGMFINT